MFINNNFFKYNNCFKVATINNYAYIFNILNDITYYINNGKKLYDNEKEHQDYNSTELTLINYNNINYVIKRYYIKGIINYIKRSTRKSRAIISWHSSHKFAKLGFNIAKPVAVMEKRKFGLWFEAYYISEYVSGVQLGEQLTNINQQLEINKLIKLMQLFIKYKIIHGDLKGNNLLWCNNDWYLIDFDNAKTNFKYTTKSFTKEYNKDRVRLLRNFNNNKQLYNLLDLKLPKL